MGRGLLMGSVLALLTLTACSGSDDGPETDPSSGVTPLADEYSVLGALAEVPAIDEEGLQVRTADLRQASEAAGLQVPGSASREEVTPWVLALSGRPAPAGDSSPVVVPWPESFNLQAASPEEFAELLGFSVVDVGAFVEASAPPLSFTTVVGEDDLTPSDDLVELQEGIVTDRDAEDLQQDLGDPSAASRIGVPVRVAGGAGRVAFGPSTPMLRSWLDGATSLADDAGLASVAAALDERDVASAVLMPVQTGGDPIVESLDGRVTPDQAKQLEDDLGDQLPEQSFDAVAVGWGAQGDDPTADVAYHFASAEYAERAAPVLQDAYAEGSSASTRMPYSDFLSVDDVTTDGPVVTVGVTAVEERRAGFLLDAFQQRDLLFASR